MESELARHRRRLNAEAPAYRTQRLPQIETLPVSWGVPTPRLIPRRATAQVNAALADTRVVLINGARQAGKSTLVRIVAGDRLAERRDLDRAQDRAAAIADPVG